MSHNLKHPKFVKVVILANNFLDHNLTRKWKKWGTFFNSHKKRSENFEMELKKVLQVEFTNQTNQNKLNKRAIIILLVWAHGLSLGEHTNHYY